MQNFCKSLLLSTTIAAFGVSVAQAQTTQNPTQDRDNQDRTYQDRPTQIEPTPEDMDRSDQMDEEEDWTTEGARSDVDEYQDTDMMDRSDASDKIRLTRSMVSVDDLLDEDVEGPNDADFGDIEDLIIGSGGSVDSVIVRLDDDWGLDTELTEVRFSDLSMRIEDNEIGTGHDLDVMASDATQDYVNNLGDYTTNAENMVNSASYIIGSRVSLSDRNDRVRIKDLILNMDGDVLYALVGDGELGTDYAIEYNKISQNNNMMQIDMDRNALEASRKFDYQFFD